MDTFIFDGHSYDITDVVRAFKEAAYGLPPTNDREVIFNPEFFADRLIEVAATTTLRPLVVQTLGQMIQSEDTQVRRLAIQVQFHQSLASAEDTFSALQKRMQLGDAQGIASLAAVLARFLDRGEFLYTPVLRDLKNYAPAKESMMKAYLLFDRDWLLNHWEEMIPSDPQEALSLMASGCAGVPVKDLPGLLKDISSVQNKLSEKLAKAIASYLDLLQRKVDGEGQNKQYPYAGSV